MDVKKRCTYWAYLHPSSKFNVIWLGVSLSGQTDSMASLAELNTMFGGRSYTTAGQQKPLAAWLSPFQFNIHYNSNWSWSKKKKRKTHTKNNYSKTVFFFSRMYGEENDTFLDSKQDTQHECKYKKTHFMSYMKRFYGARVGMDFIRNIIRQSECGMCEVTQWTE